MRLFLLIYDDKSRLGARLSGNAALLISRFREWAGSSDTRVSRVYFESPRLHSVATNVNHELSAYHEQR